MNTMSLRVSLPLAFCLVAPLASARPALGTQERAPQGQSRDSQQRGTPPAPKPAPQDDAAQKRKQQQEREAQEKQRQAEKQRQGERQPDGLQPDGRQQPQPQRPPQPAPQPAPETDQDRLEQRKANARAQQQAEQEQLEQRKANARAKQQEGAAEGGRAPLPDAQRDAVDRWAAEMRTHLDRVARIERLKELAAASQQRERVTELDQLLTRENKRHEGKLARIESALDPTVLRQLQARLGKIDGPAPQGGPAPQRGQTPPADRTPADSVGGARKDPAAGERKEGVEGKPKDAGDGANRGALEGARKNDPQKKNEAPGGGAR